ncbi:cupin domain-containing protein [Leptospira stimsonii]|uniref:Cupin domain-containing protein n=1 Tax=Leptospira stimsonii TaxID=2202203 RepID=A0A8B3CP35_9LEPT|nr:cupin domain-containing protein [Leptospira stimsonii]RHX85936.1 cupin domain-containing protein [Leptospira stimsonii]
MKLPILLFFVCFSLSFAQDNAKAVPVSAINRKELFTAVLGKEKSVSNVKVVEVTMGKKQRAPLHLHPCVTMGVVTEGVITFQIEGQPEQFLKAGDTFFEPENVRIAKFNNESDSTAKFVVFYLLKKEGDFTLQVIEKE